MPFVTKHVSVLEERARFQSSDSERNSTVGLVVFLLRFSKNIVSFYILAKRSLGITRPFKFPTLRQSTRSSRAITATLPGCFVMRRGNPAADPILARFPGYVTLLDRFLNVSEKRIRPCGLAPRWLFTIVTWGGKDSRSENRRKTRAGRREREEKTGC